MCEESVADMGVRDVQHACMYHGATMDEIYERERELTHQFFMTRDLAIQ